MMMGESMEAWVKMKDMMMKMDMGDMKSDMTMQMEKVEKGIMHMKEMMEHKESM